MVGDLSLQRSSPARDCSCRAELLLLMLLLWKDPNQDISGPTSGEGHKFETFCIPPLAKDPNWDILFLSTGRTQTRTFWVHPLEKDPCQDILDPSSEKRPKQGYFASFLWKRTQIGLFWVPPLSKDPNWNILGPCSGRT